MTRPAAGGRGSDPFDVQPLAAATVALAAAVAAAVAAPPAAGSGWTSDVAAEAGLPRSAIPEPVAFLQRQLRVRVAAVAGHLSGLGKLFAKPYTPEPADVVTRALLETALSAAWVVAGEGLEQRLARGLTLAQHDAGEEHKLADALRDPRPASRAVMHAAARAARSYREDLTDCVRNLELPTVKKPSATAFVRDGLAERLPDLGEYAFFYMSGVAHGRPSALLRGLDPDDGGIAGFSPSPVMAAVTWRLAAEGCHVLVSAWCQYRGTSTSTWDTEFGRIRAAVEAADRRAQAVVAADLRKRI